MTMINSYSLNDYYDEISDGIYQLLEKGMLRNNLVVIVNGTYFVEDPILKQEVRSIDGVEIKTDVTLPCDIAYVTMQRKDYEQCKYIQEKGVTYSSGTQTIHISKVELK